MSSQNDKAPSGNNARDTDEIFISDREARAPLNYQERRLKDEINDYIYLKPRKRSHRKHRSSSHKKKIKTYKKILIAIASTILAMAVIICGTLAYLIYSGSRQLLSGSEIITAPEGVETQKSGQYVLYNGVTYRFNENITNILVMGVDKERFENTSIIGTGGQSDVLILIAIDTRTGKTTLINISRDTMTDISVYSVGGSYIETQTAQICLSYAYGDGYETSCENTLTSVRRLFYNIPINSYLSLDLDGIAVVNDSVGGVDVVSPETIGTFVEGGSYHLEGDMAEEFVRTRDTEQLDSNIYRMQRQQVYLSSFISKVVSQTGEDIMTPVNLFNTAEPYVCTNLNASKVAYLAQDLYSLGGFSNIEARTLPGEVVAGEKYAEFYVSEDEFYPMFLSVFYEPV